MISALFSRKYKDVSEELISDKQVWTRIAITVGSLVAIMFVAIIAALIIGGA